MDLREGFPVVCRIDYSSEDYSQESFALKVSSSSPDPFAALGVASRFDVLQRDDFCLSGFQQALMALPVRPCIRSNSFPRPGNSYRGKSLIAIDFEGLTDGTQLA